MASSPSPFRALTFFFFLLHLSSSANHTNPNLERAFLALQAWKQAMYSDPTNFTSNWDGPSVCTYNGVFCSTSLHDPDLQVVAGIDLNHADIAGHIPDELGLLTDLALLHLNSNRFCGLLPNTLSNLTLLHELDLSNNRLVGPFPSTVLSLPSLKFLDLRYNEFEGLLPSELFEKELDAIFINNNRFTSLLPPNLGGSTASVMVFANNNLEGSLKLPSNVARLANTLEELLLVNTNVSGCLPVEVGLLHNLRVLDVSKNNIVGPIPSSLSQLMHLEQLNLAHNMMTGVVPGAVCALPSLANFSFSYNFFCEEERVCRNMSSGGRVSDDRWNCLPDKPHQRSEKACDAVNDRPVQCLEHVYEPISAMPVTAPLPSP